MLATLDNLRRKMRHREHTWKKRGDPVIRSPTEIQFLRRVMGKAALKRPKIGAAIDKTMQKRPKNLRRRCTPQDRPPAATWAFSVYVREIVRTESSAFLLH